MTSSAETAKKVNLSSIFYPPTNSDAHDQQKDGSTLCRWRGRAVLLTCSDL